MNDYIKLMRLHKPIGIFLLLWPTLWGLWLAGHGNPDGFIVIIFILGVIVMRSAGCVINDLMDYKVDRYVKRTCDRPLASGKISKKNAIILFILLMLMALLLVLACNRFTCLLAIMGAGFAIFYPLMKRFTHLPQVGLGFAFAWGVPMAFAALTSTIPMRAWVLFFAAVIWPVIYDTMYAMVDRDDDLKIGVKSTAILFGKIDRLIIGILQISFLMCMCWVGVLFQLKIFYFLSVILTALLFIYQQYLIKDRNRDDCFKAFLNNNWVGLMLFLGIAISYLF